MTNYPQREHGHVTDFWNGCSYGLEIWYANGVCEVLAGQAQERGPPPNLCNG